MAKWIFLVRIIGVWLLSVIPQLGLISPNLEVGLEVVYATGAETDPNGNVRLVASIYRSPAGGGLQLNTGNVIDPLGLGVALENPNAEIQLVVRSHGASQSNARGNFGDAALVHPQISNFLELFCSDPNLNFVSGPNTCQDIQIAVFGSGEAGADYINSIGSGSLVGTATLVRNGDNVQAIVETNVRR